MVKRQYGTIIVVVQTPYTYVELYRSFNQTHTGGRIPHRNYRFLSKVSKTLGIVRLMCHSEVRGNTAFVVVESQSLQRRQPLVTARYHTRLVELLNTHSICPELVKIDM